MNITNEKLAQIALQTEQGFLINNIEKFVTQFTAIEDVEIMAITSCWLKPFISGHFINPSKVSISMLSDYVFDKCKYKQWLPEGI